MRRTTIHAVGALLACAALLQADAAVAARRAEHANALPAEEASAADAEHASAADPEHLSGANTERASAARANGEHGGRYENPPGSTRRTSIVTRLPTLIARFIRHTVKPVTNDRSHILPHATALALLEAAAGDNSITWIGHMTALLEIDGRTVLTDPWWANYASPVPGFGPKRYAPPALALEELPPIDLVIVSHGHYDHLDKRAIARLPSRATATAVVPLGLGGFFRDAGYGAVVELAWDESVDVNGMLVTARPAIHWSKRRAFKTNDTLWAAFAIEGPRGTRVFFGGDSDYGPVHTAVSQRWRGFDLAILSIGGFHNDGVHCEPEDCVLIGMGVDARVLVPLHWGTIYLGEGPPQELPARFAAAAASHGYDASRVWTMRIGETRSWPVPSRAPRTLVATSAGRP